MRQEEWEGKPIMMHFPFASELYVGHKKRIGYDYK